MSVPVLRRLRVSARHQGAVLTVMALAAATFTATVAVAPAAQAGWSAGGCASRTVRMSSTRDSCALLLQRRLTALHYDVGTPDGYFGPQTFHAVVALQKVSEMRRTGVVDRATWTRLARPLTPRLRYIHAGSGLEVDLHKQVLYRAAGGALVRIYDVSTGRAAYPTPVTGARPMSIWRKVAWGTTMGTDTEHYVQYYATTRWLLAIHEYGSVPPYPASHGCIRTPPGSAGRLYAVTYVGERLYTYW